MIRAYDDYGNVVDLVEWEKEIRSDERRKVLHEQRALDVNLQISAEEIRADERAKVVSLLFTTINEIECESLKCQNVDTCIKNKAYKALLKIQEQLKGGTK